MNDRPIHLLGDVAVAGAERSVTVPVRLTQSNLDGLCALIKWLEGWQAANQTQVAGAWELMQHYRQLDSAIREASQKEG